MPIDYAKYPPNWLTEIRPRIMNRAKNKCEICGLNHLQFVWAVNFNIRDKDGRYKQKSVWFNNENCAKREGEYQRRVRVVLTIAHLDHDEKNMDITDERLQALCQLCHLRYDVQEKYQRSLLIRTDGK